MLEIVQRSVDHNNADWAAAPQYSFTERDTIVKGGQRTIKTYRVFMIEGSPYNQLVAVNDQPLSSEETAKEKAKLQQEIDRRRRETTSARQRRTAQYQRDRRQDHELMEEMIKAFDFKLLGDAVVNGRRCYEFAASPRQDYQPPSRDTRVLKGMRGKMWIDAEQDQWVRVEASVFRPVAFGLFIAHVEPGTEFTLEKAPVSGNLWQPSHFSMQVKSKILFVSHKSMDDETYSDYQRAPRPDTVQAGHVSEK